jgi:hypothetical protein
MSKHRASCWIAVCSLLALTPVSASPAPRLGDPCKQMHHSLDRQIDDLKAQQKVELLQCEQSNGRGSGACLSLKDQQRQTLHTMRDGRTNQMNDCYGRPFLSASTLQATESEYHNHYDQANNEYPDNEYPDTERHHHKIPDPHPRHPRHYPTATNGVKSASSDKPSKNSDHSVTKTSHANAGAGSPSSGGSTASASHNHNGGGGSSGGGSYSGSSHSSGGGSYSGSSHSSGGGSSSYSGGSSGSSGSSASSHSSGGGGGSYSGGPSSSGSSSSTSAASSGGHPK